VRVTGVVAAALVLLASASAAAPGRADKRACVAANEGAQKLRREGHLRAAREQLLVCAKPECPVVVRQDCAQWLNEVVAATPSVVVAARDASGKETLAVKVTIDGELVLSKLDGKAMTIDPGVHKFKYESDDGLVHEEEIAVREGEKNRVLYVNFHKPAAPEPPAPSPAPLAAQPSAKPATTIVTTRSAVPAGAFVFGAVGVAGIGVGAYLVASASSDVSNLRSTCAPSCAHTDVSSARSKALVGDVLLGAGAAALVAAAWMALLRPTTERVETTTALDVGATPGGAILTARGRF
jgi:hypothetical protein